MTTTSKCSRSVLDLIGSTPVVRLTKLPGSELAEIWGKLESLNPGGSVKDRICRSMVEDGERKGLLKPGGTIVEPTSGNTGIGLALVAAVKGYRLILTMPDTMSEERRNLLVAYGARLILTPRHQGDGRRHPEGRGAGLGASRLLHAPAIHQPRQSRGPPGDHRNGAAEPVRAYRRLRQRRGNGGAPSPGWARCCGTGSRPSGFTRSNLRPPPCSPRENPASTRSRGLGAGFVPPILNTGIYDEVITVSDEDAAATTHRLAVEEGIFVGISSGANCFAAMQVAKAMGTGPPGGHHAVRQRRTLPQHPYLVSCPR